MTTKAATAYKNGAGPHMDFSRAKVADPLPEPPLIEEERHPLDVDEVKCLNLGWIDRYADLMTRLTGSPRQFHVLVGLTVAATATQRRACLTLPWDTVHPNLYGCVIAQSTVFGKTTALNKARPVLQGAMMDNLIIPAYGSSEGLIQTLSEQPAAVMIRDEIGTLFGADRVKYLKDYKQDLTKLYDCTPYSRRLRNDTVRVDKPFLNIIGATTPQKFYANTGGADWADGLLPRWLFAIAPDKPNFDFVPPAYSEKIAAEMQSLSYSLMVMEQQRETSFALEDGALDIWQAWRKPALEAAWKADDEQSLAIIGRYATYALKFSIILSAVNGSWGTITIDTMQASIGLAENFKRTVYRIIRDTDKHKLTGDKIQKVFAAIRDKNEGYGVTARTIMQLTHMKKAELQPCLDALLERGAITSESTGKTGKVVAYRIGVKELPITKWG
ncbi:MAG: DUF3987 domain-containing protein [Caldilineaceae bacterium]|nr:DUF3987 domain-containing protein [Caldilineaceae bacterium]